MMLGRKQKNSNISHRNALSQRKPFDQPKLKYTLDLLENINGIKSDETCTSLVTIVLLTDA